MPVKKKGRKPGKKKGKSSKSKAVEASKDPMAPAYIPPPPLPMERLVDLLTTNEVDERELYGMKISSRALQKLSPQEIRDLRIVFEAFDWQNCGLMGPVDLRKALRTLGFKVNRDQAKRMVHDASIEGKAMVDFNEFLDVIIDQQGDSKDIYEEIIQGFKLFDMNDTGMICMEELKAACKETETKLSKQELQDMIEEADTNGDGKVDREEFVKIMLQTNLF